jgi:hypothetical protein
MGQASARSELMQLRPAGVGGRCGSTWRQGVSCGTCRRSWWLHYEQEQGTNTMVEMDYGKVAKQKN